MKKVGVIMVAGLLTAMASPATAQDFPREQAIAVTHGYANCLLSSQGRYVVRFLEAMPGSPEEVRAGSVLFNRSPSCLSDRVPGEGSDILALRFQPRTIRGVLAEAIFKRDFSRVGVPNRQPIRFPDLEVMAQSLLADDEASRSQRMAVVIGAFAACVAEAEPALAWRLLQTAPTTEAEISAFADLQTAFGPCFPEGEQFTINRPMLRGFLAEGLYRYSARLAAEGGAN